MKNTGIFGQNSSLAGCLRNGPPRIDGVGACAIWTPKEAVFAYNHLRLGHKGRAVRHKDCRGMVILPKGDVEYCPRHDHYMYRGEPCFQCWLERVVLKVK